MKKAKKLLVGSLILFTLFWVGAGEVDQRTFVNITKPGSGRTQGQTRAVRGVYLHSRAIDVKNTKNWINKLEENELNGVVINVKNVSGEVTYDSEVQLAKSMGTVTGRLDLEKIIKKLHENGIYVIARLTCFKDPVLADRCCGGGNWADPTSSVAQNYLIDLAREVADFGFDEIQLDYIRYSDGPGEIGGNYEKRSRIIANFVEEMRESLPAQVRLSADVYGRTMWNWNSENKDPIGQNLEYLDGPTDFLSPMIYPSHYTNPDLVYNPGKLIELSMETGMERVSGEFRPFIQGFERAMPSGVSLVEYIREELRALERVGVEGYLVWNPKSNYNALWRALESPAGE